MRLAALGLAVAVGAGGFALGRQTAEPAVRTQVVREWRAPAAPTPGPVGCDEAQLAAAVARTLRDEPAPTPEPPAPPPPPTAGAARGDELLARARGSGRWTARDAEELRASLREMSPDERQAALAALNGALNRGELASDLLPPL